jgi:hypothetical protein
MCWSESFGRVCAECVLIVADLWCVRSLLIAIRVVTCFQDPSVVWQTCVQACAVALAPRLEVCMHCATGGECAMDRSRMPRHEQRHGCTSARGVSITRGHTFTGALCISSVENVHRMPPLQYFFSSQPMHVLGWQHVFHMPCAFASVSHCIRPFRLTLRSECVHVPEIRFHSGCCRPWPRLCLSVAMAAVCTATP